MYIELNQHGQPLHHILPTPMATMFAGPLNSPYIRLTAGPTPAEGRVELVRNGQWGGVCPVTKYDGTFATVICRQLGYHRGVALAWGAYSYSWYASYSVRSCTGMEASLLECNGAIGLPNGFQAPCPQGVWAALAVSCSSPEGRLQTSVMKNQIPAYMQRSIFAVLTLHAMLICTKTTCLCLRDLKSLALNARAEWNSARI